MNAKLILGGCVATLLAACGTLSDTTENLASEDRIDPTGDENAASFTVQYAMNAASGACRLIDRKSSTSSRP